MRSWHPPGNCGVEQTLRTVIWLDSYKNHNIRSWSVYSITTVIIRPFTQFHVTEESLGHHYNVVAADDAGGKHQFFIENSPSAAKKPDLTIYDGADSQGPMVGICKFHRFSSNCDVNIVDGHVDTNDRWKSVTKKGIVSPSFAFQIPVHGQMANLAWKKTRSMGSASSPYGNMKLVNEQSEDVPAVFSSDPFSLVTGRLDMRGDFGESFDRWALLTGVAVRERQRRQNTRPVRTRDNVYTMGAAVGVAGGGMGGGA